MMKDIDADYYGYMDDDDGILLPLETQAEKICKSLNMRRYNKITSLIIIRAG